MRHQPIVLIKQKNPKHFPTGWCLTKLVISVGETPTDSINTTKKSEAKCFGFFILIKLKNYLITPNSLPTLVKAAMALSKSSRSCPALICTRIRALPFATTG